MDLLYPQGIVHFEIPKVENMNQEKQWAATCHFENYEIWDSNLRGVLDRDMLKVETKFVTWDKFYFLLFISVTIDYIRIQK